MRSISPVRAAVIPVAGLGTRLLPLSRAIPKELLPVGRYPALHYIVSELLQGGMEHLIFVTHRHKMAIADYLEETPEFAGHASFTYVFQNEQRGLGHAILQAESALGKEPFLVALGDAIITSRSLIGRMLEAHQTSGAAGVIAFEEVPRDLVSRYGIADARGDGNVFEVAALIEKPDPDKAPGILAISARYLLEPDIFRYLRATPPGHSGEIQLTDAIRSLIAGGQRVLGVRLLPGERRYDIGSFETYTEAFIDFALRDERSGPDLTRLLHRCLGLAGKGPGG